MKQHITINQWKELNENQKIKWLNEIWYVHGLSFQEDVKNMKKIIPRWTIKDELIDLEGKFGDFTETKLELPNIGQMIGFLTNYKDHIYLGGITLDSHQWVVSSRRKDEIATEHIRVEICDALWEAVKEILEK